VRITGQIVDEDRTFNFAQNARITRGGEEIEIEDVQEGDIAFFSFRGGFIHEVDFMERERTLTGTLSKVRPPENHNGTAVLVLEMTGGQTYELRVLPATTFARGTTQDLDWSDIRVGDAITAEVEFDRLVSIHAVGERSTLDGRLIGMIITELNTQITITRADDSTSTFIVRPGVFDVYSLRIGSRLRVSLDSREVTNIQVQGTGQSVVLGVIQSIREDGSIVVAEPGAEGTRTIAVGAGVEISRGGASINYDALRVNMNVYIVLTAPQSTAARSIVVLP